MRGMALLAATFFLAAAASAALPARAAPLAAGTTIPGGTITDNTTWTLAGSPYHIEGNVSVSLLWGNYTTGLTVGDLIIEPGVQVLFDGNYSLRLWYGRIFANGTANAPVEFAPAVDNGRPMQWGWLDLTAGHFIHVIAGTAVFISIGTYSGPQSLDNSTVDSTYWGLVSYSNAVTVTRCTFRNTLDAALDLQGTGDSLFANVTIDHAAAAISLDHIGHTDTGADPMRNVFDHLTVTNSTVGVRVNGGGFYTPWSTNLLVNSSFSSVGIVFPSPFSGKVYRNNFLDSGADFGFSSGGIGLYDNGTAGNYWSHYNGTDADHDGIGDTPYGPDRYPLMSPIAAAGAGGGPPGSGSSGPASSNGLGAGAVLILVLVAAVAWIVILAVFLGRRRPR